MGRTVQSLLDTSELGKELEILVVLDGWKPTLPIPNDPRVKIIELERNQGMRNAINEGLKQSQGEYIIKLDPHCAVDQGFDKKMVENTRENWLTIPSRYSLDEGNWTRNLHRPIREYHYLSFPTKERYALDSINWSRPGRGKILIDNVMTTQGSCWCANRKYFMKHVGLLDDKNYGSFVGEAQEIGMKYWLGDGEMKVIKTTWYAHLSKRSSHFASGEYERASKKDKMATKGNAYCVDYWMAHPKFKDFIKRFSPPTWPK